MKPGLGQQNLWHKDPSRHVVDTLRPLVLLSGRQQRTLMVWFRQYPKIQVVSRDGGGIYATAAHEGAPQAKQVDDRWHLLKNIGDALERMMFRQMPLIRQVATELSPKNHAQEVQPDGAAIPAGHWTSVERRSIRWH